MMNTQIKTWKMINLPRCTHALIRNTSSRFLFLPHPMETRALTLNVSPCAAPLRHPSVSLGLLLMSSIVLTEGRGGPKARPAVRPLV